MKAAPTQHTTSRVVVADGYGISLTVNRGHLVIHDGIGSHRRTRRYPRIQRDLRRIVMPATPDR